jgi:hypothetical protein
MALLASFSSQYPPDGLWAGWSRFVPRLSWHDGDLLSGLPADRSTTIAKSLAQAGGDAQLVFDAHKEPEHKVVLEPEAWHNQRPRKDRSREFRRLGSKASLARTLDPATLRSASASAIAEYVSAFVSWERTRGSDAVLLPAHLAGGYSQRSREGELRLAEHGVALVQRHGLAELDDVRKPLLVAIAIDAKTITSEDEAVELARSYAALGGDGYWVQFAWLSEAAHVPTATACTTFLFALQEISQRDVFAVDTKNLTWPLLAAGLSGGCIGIGEREAWSGPQAASTEPRAIKPSVVHPVLLRNLRLDGPHIAAAFKQLLCDCGAHSHGVPPLTRPTIRRHALHVRLEMAEAVTGEQAVSTFSRWLYDAGWLAFDLGLDAPPTATYRAVLDAAAAWPAVGEP